MTLNEAFEQLGAAKAKLHAAIGDAVEPYLMPIIHWLSEQLK